MAREPNTLGQASDKAQGTTYRYRVIPQRTDSFIDALQRGYLDLQFHSNGRANESGLELSRPNIFNGQRWGYGSVYQWPRPAVEGVYHVGDDCFGFTDLPKGWRPAR